MTAKELRIGDLVRVGKDVCLKKGTIVEIRGINGDVTTNLLDKTLKGSVTCVDVNDPDEITFGVWLEYLEPIGITEEMLLHWGFRFDGMNAYIIEQRRGIHDTNGKPNYLIKVIPPQPDNDDWWMPDDTGFEVFNGNADMLLAGQKDTYYHVLQHLLCDAGLEDIVKLKLGE